MKKKTTFLFDVDGTLLDTRELIYQSMKLLADDLQLQLPDRSIIEATIGLPASDGLRIIFNTLPQEKISEAMDIYRARQWELWENMINVFPTVNEGLNLLSDRNAILAVVTSRRRASLIPYLKASNLLDFFAAIVTPEDTILHKPNPDPAEKALAVLCKSAEEAVFVGDSEFDISCANQAGITSVLVSWGMSPTGWKYSVSH